MGNSQACFSNASNLVSKDEHWREKAPYKKSLKMRNHRKFEKKVEINGNNDDNNVSTVTYDSLYLNYSNLSALENETPLARPKLVNDVSPTYASAVSDDVFDYDTPGNGVGHNEDGGGDENVDGYPQERISLNKNDHGTPIIKNEIEHKQVLNPHFEFNVDTYVPENSSNVQNQHTVIQETETIEVPNDEIPRELGVDIIKTLGDGVSGTVFEVKDIRTGHHYAMKRLRRSDKLAEWLFITECSFLKKVRCKGVIEMVDCFVGEKYYFILTELGNIDLFTRLKTEKRIPEHISREIIFRLLKTLALLHKHNVVHRDVKPENIVFTKRGTLLQPKMIDFGDAVVVKDNQLYNELVGTRCYLSPERWRQHYGYELKSSDVWAVGVLTYEMVTGKRCFYASNDDRLTEKIQCGKWQFPADSCVSELCADFIKRMLTLSPKRRPTAEYAMKHPFFTCVPNIGSNEGIMNPTGMEKCIQHKHALSVWCGEFSRRSTYYSRHLTDIDPVV